LGSLPAPFSLHFFPPTLDHDPRYLTSSLLRELISSIFKILLISTTYESINEYQIHTPPNIKEKIDLVVADV
jgi:hypothetical protein